MELNLRVTLGINVCGYLGVRFREEEINTIVMFTVNGFKKSAPCLEPWVEEGVNPVGITLDNLCKVRVFRTKSGHLPWGLPSKPVFSLQTSTI